jgi:hypothetical protein
MNKCMLLFILVFLISGCSTGSSPDPDPAPMSPLELTLGWSPDPQGEGRYSTQIVFPNAGRYHVMYHVTARDMHAMDKAELIVEDK